MSLYARRRRSQKEVFNELVLRMAERIGEDAEETERLERVKAKSRTSEEDEARRSGCSSRLDSEDSREEPVVLEEDEGFSDWSLRLENQRNREQEQASVPERQPGSKDQIKQEKADISELSFGSPLSLRAVTPDTQERTSNKDFKGRCRSKVLLSQDAGRHILVSQSTDRTIPMPTGPRSCREVIDGTEPEGGRVKESEVLKIKAKREELLLTAEGGITVEEAKIERSLEDKYELPKTRRASSPQYSSAMGDSAHGYGPMSPTFKKLLNQFYPEEVPSRVPTDTKCKMIAESLGKSGNNVKKSTPPQPVSKIDKRLQQYTLALESTKESRSAPSDLADCIQPEPVAYKKTLFEGGDSWKQNSSSVTANKVKV